MSFSFELQSLISVLLNVLVLRPYHTKHKRKKLEACLNVYEVIYKNTIQKHFLESMHHIKIKHVRKRHFWTNQTFMDEYGNDCRKQELCIHLV